jgi:hypothetical protein
VEVAVVVREAVVEELAAHLILLQQVVEVQAVAALVVMEPLAIQ